MTYSFRASGTCKVDALLDLDLQVDKSDLTQQDRDIICKHARDVIITLTDPTFEEIIVISCHGYSVTAPGSGRRMSASCGVSAYVMPVI